MPQVVIASVDHCCDGLMTDMYRFDVPPCVIRASVEDPHAAARWIKGVVTITDPTEWFVINDGSLTERQTERIDPTGWHHHSGIDFQTVKGNIFS